MSVLHRLLTFAFEGWKAVGMNYQIEEVREDLRNLNM